MRSSLLTFLLATCTLLATAQTQKFGHLNSAALLQQLPEVKSADATLEGFQAGLMSSGQGKVKALEKMFQDYQKEVDAGGLSRNQMAQRETRINEEREAIATYEKEVQLEIIKKRQELLDPILKKVDEAIQAIGKENGYSMIFDTSVSGTMLYAPEGDDLLDQVLAKMGAPK